MGPALDGFKRHRHLWVIVVAAVGGCLGSFSEDASVGRAPLARGDDSPDAGVGDAGVRRGGTYRIFLTDGFREDWSRVDATILRLETVTTTGETSTAFEEPFGLLVDLHSLRNASGRLFLPLDEAEAPQDPVDRVRVTLLPKLTLKRAAALDFLTATITSALPRDARGNVVVEVPLAAPRDPSGTGVLVLDFDLSRFTLVGDVITPVVTEFVTDSVTAPAVQAFVAGFGLVTDYSAASRFPTFRLNGFDGRDFNVEMDAATSVTADAGGAPPTFGNGARVQVQATWNQASGTYVATRIVVVLGPPALVVGPVRGIALASRTISMGIDSAEGIQLGISGIDVALSAVTRCIGVDGAPAQCASFLLGEATGKTLSIVGYPYSDLGLLTGGVVRIVAPAEAIAEGARGAFEAPTSNLTITGLTRADGLPGGTTTIVAHVGPTAVVRDVTGELLSRRAFDLAITTAGQVRVRGPVVGGAIEARDVRILAP